MKNKTTIYFLKFNQIKSLGHHGIDSLVSTGKETKFTATDLFLKGILLDEKVRHFDRCQIFIWKRCSGIYKYFAHGMSACSYVSTMRVRTTYGGNPQAYDTSAMSTIGKAGEGEGEWIRRCLLYLTASSF